MNAGALNGPVIGARSGRWRVWERTQDPATSVSNVWVQPVTAYHMVPVPNTAAAVKLTATAGSTTDNAATLGVAAYSGPACKDIVLPWGDGKQLVVALGATVTVALFAKGTRQGGDLGSFSLSDAEIAVQLTNSSMTGATPTITSGTAQVYWRNISLVSVGGTLVTNSLAPYQLAAPILNGMLYGAVALNSAGVVYPLISSPQTRANSGVGNFMPSTLFGMADPSTTAQGMPGQSVFGSSSTPYPPSPSYVKLEWME
jgi:hypothetical protein